MQRHSEQRDVIQEELGKLSSHPTATELHEIVRRRLPRISLGTVYRNLELLARNGLIRRIEMGHGRTRFDGNLEPHHHVRCVHCQRVTDVHDAPPDLAPEGIARLSDHEILALRVEAVGICPACREQLAPAGIERLRREWQ